MTVPEVERELRLRCTSIDMMMEMMMDAGGAKHVCEAYLRITARAAYVGLKE